ncbi:HU family DNA-binding protein [Alienimonas californiensis]|uniref:DNA-binding protein HU n=1 Tax=Alienimonas californiensis TaxID=2527989 RepID=A0A517P7F3_9PLAN|nr:HU family DNA-binding protein [Alienimonas californiensis]QDT15302.1 DNA-binding protein HU [Alienimonas californiensis]
MTKKEIVKAIADELGLTQMAVKEVVQMTFDHIVDTLVDDRRIELRNFGVFEVKRRAARQARNPKTGEPVEVKARYVVAFKPGKEMEERVKLMERREREKAEEARLRERHAQQFAPPPPAGQAPAAGRGYAQPQSPPHAPAPPQSADRLPVRPDPPPAATSAGD